MIFLATAQSLGGKLISRCDALLTQVGCQTASMRSVFLGGLQQRSSRDIGRSGGCHSLLRQSTACGFPVLNRARACQGFETLRTFYNQVWQHTTQELNDARSIADRERPHVGLTPRLRRITQANIASAAANSLRLQECLDLKYHLILVRRLYHRQARRASLWLVVYRSLTVEEPCYIWEGHRQY